MKNSHSGNFKIGNTTILSSGEDIFILRRGKEKVYLNKFRKPSAITRKKGLVLCAIVLAAGLLIALLSGGEREGAPKSDEERKNELIRSARTDFSAPKGHAKLSVREHTIQRGETLSHIAKQYGVSMDTICGSNKLMSYDMVSEGQRLKIPNKDGIIHSMKKGQNIHSIARLYRTSVDKILAENNIRNQDFIPVGDSVFIPDAKPLDMVPGLLWPAPGRAITCGFGWRRNPFNSGEVEFHRGLDIRMNYQWVKSVKYGKVTFAGWLGGYGKAVLIAHPGGFKSLYGHLSRIIVREGQYVRQGQFVGKSGNTGYSTGAHLHFELIKNGRHRNPFRYVK